MKKYQEITFLQGEAATEAIALLEDHGEEAALDYLKQWDNGDDSMCYDESPAGSYDQIYREGDYELNYNTALEYIGLYKIIREETCACILSGKLK